MQRVTTYIILAAVFFSGLLLIYRSSFQSRYLNKIEGRVIGKTVERVYEHKGKTYYALTFTLQDQKVKPGIYTGTELHHELISKIYTGVVYQFFMDKDSATSDGLNLGVREIRLGREVIYKESGRSSLWAGISLSLIALVASILLWTYHRRKRY